jgi:hypothetical protein
MNIKDWSGNLDLIWADVIKVDPDKRIAIGWFIISERS